MSRRLKATFKSLISASIAALAFSSCNTYEAVAMAPEGYWLYTWSIVEAFVADVISILELLL